MSIDISTFLLEIMNFLILLWILKKFFYLPVLNLIQKRRNEIEAQLHEAEQLKIDSLALKQQYETQLLQWQDERIKAEEVLQQELHSRKDEMLLKLNNELKQEQQKQWVVFEKQQAEWQKQAEWQALKQGAKFASGFLSSLASPELESRLFDLFIQQLEQLNTDERRQLNMAMDKASDIDVYSCYPLHEEQQKNLHELLESLLNKKINLLVKQDGSLICGLKLSFGERVLHANIKHELVFFTDTSYEL